ncbi:MAG: ABC transporter permease subunit [bacterium]|nr:ABC transporter permease subunit [bacterium]
MKNIIALFLREFKSYFISPIAYVVLTMFLIITGYFFYANLSVFLDYMTNMMAQAQYYRQLPPPVDVNDYVIMPLFHNFSIVLLFMLPMITMRLFAEEKKTMTIELLMTSPLTTVQTVLGKYFAALALFIVMLLPTVIYFIIIGIYGNPELYPILTSYLGLFFLGASLMGIGLLISSLTENQIIAAAVTFGIYLLLWTIGWMASFAGPKFAAVINYLSIINHFNDFTRGVFDTKHILFYLSFAFFGLYLTYRSVESIRWRV